jgi:hypothetical protein
MAVSDLFIHSRQKAARQRNHVEALMTGVSLFPFAKYWWFYGAFALFILGTLALDLRYLSPAGARDLGARGDYEECCLDCPGTRLCWPSLCLLLLELPPRPTPERTAGRRRRMSGLADNHGIPSPCSDRLQKRFKATQITSPNRRTPNRGK